MIRFAAPLFAVSIFFLAAFGSFSKALASPIEVMRGVRINSCNEVVCIEVFSPVVSRSVLRNEYALEQADIKIVRLQPSRETVALKAISARTDEHWSIWLIQTKNGLRLLDATTGVLE